MYESHWQLSTKPFEDTTDARFFVPLDMYQGALLKLRYAIENHRGAALLAAAAGLGKTLLVRSLFGDAGPTTDCGDDANRPAMPPSAAIAGQLDASFSPVVHVVFPQMPADQLLAYVAESLAGVPVSGAAPAINRSVRMIEQTLQKNAAAGRHAVLVLDEAHDLEDMGALETIRLLLNFMVNGRVPLTVLLVGQPALLPAIDRARDLDGRLAVKCLLRPLTVLETKRYVEYRMQAAGATRAVFQPDAFAAIHRVTQGGPRRINRLCDLALLIGFAEDRATINVAQIDSVAEELVTTALT